MGFHTKHCLIICQHVIITVSLISFFSGNYFILFFFIQKQRQIESHLKLKEFIQQFSGLRDCRLQKDLIVN